MSETVDPQARRVVARAWKDEEFRNGLPDEVREKLPPAPDGAARMSDEELEAAAGAGTPLVFRTVAAGAGLFSFGMATEDKLN